MLPKYCRKSLELFTSVEHAQIIYVMDKCTKAKKNISSAYKTPIFLLESLIEYMTPLVKFEAHKRIITPCRNAFA